ncbi:MAG: membrane protein insertase YidC [Kofleriaceae bacterium]|nr:membrane protein insertase YidC [Kofleriaceae bacterium]
MQEQGKRLLLAAIIAIGVLFAWNAAFPTKKNPPKPVVAAGSGSAGSGAAIAVTPQSPVGQPALPVAGTPAVVPTEAPRGAEQTLTVTSANFTATFTNWGGALKSWHLADRRYDRDVGKGEMIPQFPDSTALQVNFVNSTYVVPKSAEWIGEKISDTQVRYSYKNEHLALVKTFTVYPENYLLRINVEATLLAAGEARQTLTLTTFGYQDIKNDGGGGQSVKARAWVSATRRNGENFATPVKKLAEFARVESNIDWTGFEHPYLLAIVSPHKSGTEQIEKHTYAGASPGLMQTDIWYPTVVMTSAAGTVTREAVAYIGPNNYDKLQKADDIAGYPTGFHGVVDLGWFKFIGRPLLWLLKAIHGVVGNWGVAIILLTFLVKLATLYWTTKSMRSMKAMGALAPKMKELQERYKGDRQRLQQEQMALYKTHGVNPLAGCLPMLLQMPIWIALYRMLSSAGELYLQPFIPGWINDLTNTDPLHILPAILMVTMFVQSRLTPTTGDGAQQKIMMIVMPLMFGVMSFFFPAGLTLYIFTNTLLSALHSVYMNKYDAKSKAAMAAVVAASAPAVVTHAPTTAKAGKPAPANVATNDDAQLDETNVAAPKNGASNGNKSNKSNKNKGKRR